MTDGVRLNKYISDTGFCSRRQADLYIEQGRVTINGRDCTGICMVEEGDRVAVDGEALRPRRRAVYIALNKPVGVTCTVDPQDKTNIADFVNYKERIFPIGRLDKASEGLIFLTNDGDIVNKILRAGNHHEKEYIVVVDKPITDDFLNKMAAGVRLDQNERTLPCKVSKIGENSFRIILTQGLNRQIRRMCQALHCNVVKLTRVRIMNVTIKGLSVGQWRLLTPQEMEQINNAVESSSKTASTTATTSTTKSTKFTASARSTGKAGKAGASAKFGKTSGGENSGGNGGRSKSKGAAGARDAARTTQNSRKAAPSGRKSSKQKPEHAFSETVEVGTSDRHPKRAAQTAYNKYKSKGRK